MRILIVEDEKLLAESVRLLLKQNGYEADCAYDGLSGLEQIRLGIYDLVILDLMMPGMNGLDVARSARSAHNGIPILMLTAKSDTQDRIEGLEAGADYYLTKPFDSGELLACVRALLRRQGSEVNELSCGNTALDLDTGSLRCGERAMRLSAREFDVMRLLMQAGSRNLSKEQILEHVWGFDSGAVANHVEVYVGFLRKKLAAIHSDVKIISVRRLGYHLEIQEQSGQ